MIDYDKKCNATAASANHKPSGSVWGIMRSQLGMWRKKKKKKKKCCFTLRWYYKKSTWAFFFRIIYWPKSCSYCLHALEAVTDSPRSPERQQKKKKTSACFGDFFLKIWLISFFYYLCVSFLTLLGKRTPEAESKHTFKITSTSHFSTACSVQMKLMRVELVKKKAHMS